MVQTHPEENLEICGAMLKTQDPDRWYALRFAPGTIRNALLPFYALHIELSQLVYKVKTPPLGEIRLQWWREALLEALGRAPVRAHPVVEALALVLTKSDDLEFQGLVEEKITHAIDARGRLFYEAPFEDVADLFNWAKASDGVIDGIGLKLTLGQPDFTGHEIDMQKVIEARALLTMARDGARLAPHLSSEAISGFVQEKWPDLRKVFQDCPGPLMGICLPYRMVDQYNAQKSRGTLALRRHALYFTGVLRGKI